MDYIIPILAGVVYIVISSLMKEPMRQKFNVVMIAGAGAAYFNGGFGIWEMVFTAVITFCAYHGLRHYYFIGIAWLLHTVWDVLHHFYGTPIIPFLADSSFGCAICDVIIAGWCLLGGRSVFEIIGWKQSLEKAEIN